MSIPRIFSTVCVVLAFAMATQAQDQRNPVPSAEAQQKALTLVREVYEAQYAEAKTPGRRETLAGEMVERAGETADLANKYTLLRVARDLSIQGDGTTAFLAVDEMAGSFQIDRLVMNTEVLAQCAVLATTAARNKAVSEKAAELIDSALTADNFALAGRLAELGLTAAKKARDGTLIKRLTTLGDEVEGAATAYAAVKPAFAVLQTKPADPDANLAVGKYFCFRKGDWGRGLLMLSLGSNTALKDVATREINGPSAVSDQMALGDGWWNLAQTAEGNEKTAMLLQAGRWYKTAETKLTGLDKAKVGKRLAEIAEIAAAVQPGLAVTRPGQLPRGEWTEVLPWVDIRRDTADGAWFRQGPLVVGRWGQGRLMLPVRIDGEYDLRVEFRPSRDPNGGLIGLPVGKTNCMLSVGTVPAQGGRIGLSNVDGKPALDNVTTVRGFKLAKNQSYLVDIQVRVKGDGATIRVVVNGKLAMNWSGKQSSLTMPAEWAVPEIDRPAIGVYRMIAAFRRAAVRPVSGTAVRIGADAGGERGE